ncbi:hypothetical protein PR202_ga06781 [Eleusine coracana subsp. coracana]|uniref:Lipoxygenase n=1 Tax=Eleusine coracana subsp. coracana TaxID=191504 RepID=A0AAV5BVV5_ELECO|nr:hypothetical protein PR202_ga06781 [Eleusine coracana subsp. coracana]
MIHLNHLKHALVLPAQSNNVGSLLPSPPSATRRVVGAGGRRQSMPRISCCSATEEVGGVSSLTVEKALTVKGTVEAAPAIGQMYATRGLDDFSDLFGKTLLLELVSSELDPKTGQEKPRVTGFAHRTLVEGRYEAEFKVPPSFGPVGAVLVENEHHKEMFIKEIKLTTGDDESTAVTFDCNSWVHSKFDNKEKRIFFTIKSYLPSSTPKALEVLRKKDLEALRGDGHGERKCFERVYDYDVYNDLGDPDKNPAHQRPVLGGSQQYPYPRPFSEVKQLTFGATTLRSGLHMVLPALRPMLLQKELCFPHFPAIDSLYSEGIPLPTQASLDSVRSVIPRVLKLVEHTTDNVLPIRSPRHGREFAWFKDEEFARQTIAGLNPVCIQLLTEFPIMSKLDPAVYGPPESGHHQGAHRDADKGRLDSGRGPGGEAALHPGLPRRVPALRAQGPRAPRHDALRLPHRLLPHGSGHAHAAGHRAGAAQVSHAAALEARLHAPGPDATGAWLWKLAKANVLAHDTGYHQLVSHWLRTHACVEPYIIAANRQLSRMHPVYRLLHPHFRYTMEINALARESLINADGIIEESFWPGKYSIELSAVAYGLTWRFDTEALPNDLVKRGLAVRKEDGELELTIKDYPYANDGLKVWDSIKQWVTDYVKVYYKSDEDVAGDPELQAFWDDVRTKGHADKKDEPWWPVLDNRDSLVETLTTIIWVTSGHHAAVNFGQYHFGGYFPNRPTTIRRNMPVEENRDEDMNKFMAQPEMTLLQMLPNQMQAIKVMTTLDILSAHSPDEEYLGEHAEPSWLAEPMVKAAFEKFCGRMKEIEGYVDECNNNPELRNRCGAGIVPYELLKPFSKPGVTGRGIPNSISI